jgi:hypothetical protein
LPLPKWFYGVFLMSKRPAGISGKELERQLEVSYATAWRMMTQILSVKPSDVAWKRGRSSAFGAYLRNAIGSK